METLEEYMARTGGISQGIVQTPQDRSSFGFGQTSQGVFDEMEQDPDAPYLDWLYSTKAKNRKAKKYWDSFAMQAGEGVTYGEAKENVLKGEEDQKRAEYAQRMQAIVADFLNKTKDLDDAAYKQAESELLQAISQRPETPQAQTPQANPYGIMAGGLASILDPYKSSKYLQIPGMVAQQNEEMRLGNETMKYKADMDARDEQIRFLMSRVSAEDRKLAEQMRDDYNKAKFAQDELGRMGSEDAQKTKAEEAYRKGIRQLYQSAKSSNDKQVWGSQLMQLGDIDQPTLDAEVARLQTAEETAQAGKELANQGKQQTIDQKAQTFLWKVEDRPVKRKMLLEDLKAKGVRNEISERIVKKYDTILEYLKPELEAKIELMKTHMRATTPEQLQKDLSRKDAQLVYREARKGMATLEKDLRKMEDDYEAKRTQWMEIGKLPDDDMYNPADPKDSRTNKQVWEVLRTYLEQKKDDIKAIKANLERRNKVIYAWESKNVPADMSLGFSPITTGAPPQMSGPIGR